jgi:hypothetical protein
VAEDRFGPLISPEDVIDAAVETLRTWFPTYCAEVERQHGLGQKTIPRPPVPESYHGGVDLEAWIGENTPEVMVLAKPAGEPEHSASFYTGKFELTVGCLCIGAGSVLAERPEDDARKIASYLGAASMLLVQQPTLGGLTERLRLTALPDVSLPDPERRAIAQVVTGFDVWVTEVVNELSGPTGPTPQESPGYVGLEEPFGPGPVVTSEHLTVEGEQLQPPSEGD